MTAGVGAVLRAWHHGRAQGAAPAHRGRPRDLDRPDRHHARHTEAQRHHSHRRRGMVRARAQRAKKSRRARESGSSALTACGCRSSVIGAPHAGPSVRRGPLTHPMSRSESRGVASQWRASQLGLPLAHDPADPVPVLPAHLPADPGREGLRAAGAVPARPVCRRARARAWCGSGR